MRAPASPTVPGRPPLWRRRLHRHRGAVLALLSGLLVWSLTSALRPTPPEVVPVLVAARDLAPGTTLAAADLVTVALPAAARPDDAPSNSDGLVGRRVVVPLLEGDAVLPRHLLTASLLAGYGDDVVATPLRLADPSALAVLRPGDLVDVFGAVAGSATGAGSEAVVVAARVRVLLAGADAAGGAAGGILSAPSSDGTPSVVLATSSAQALEIARAAVGSRLSVVLRGG